jgi:uncharacterized membrane protein YbhN (UPF0104 family)
MLALGAVGLSILAARREADWSATAAALAGASYALVAAAAALNLAVNTPLRALRWRALLGPEPGSGRRAPIPLLYGLVLTGQAVTNVLPLRAGEVARVEALRREGAFPVETLVAAQAVEKLVEALSLLVWVVPTIALGPRWVRPSPGLLAAVAAGVAGALALAWWATRAERRHGGARVTRLGRVLRRAGAVAAPRRLIESWLWSLASDAIDLVMILACTAAVGAPIGLPAACAVLLGINIAISVPSTPGQIGALEAGAVVVLVSLGVPAPAALAAALLYHATHFVPTTLGGGAFLLWSALRPAAAVRKEIA